MRQLPLTAAAYEIATLTNEELEFHCRGFDQCIRGADRATAAKWRRAGKLFYAEFNRRRAALKSTPDFNDVSSPHHY